MIPSLHAWMGRGETCADWPSRYNKQHVNRLTRTTQVCPLFSPVYGQEKNTMLLIAAMYRNELSTERE